VKKKVLIYLVFQVTVWRNILPACSRCGSLAF